jgi:AsmA protein
MKKFVLIVLGVVVVVIGAALVLPFVVPTETYKQQVVAQVERATGRALTINGPVEFSLLPAVALHAEDVRLANAPGAAEPDMAKLKALEVELKVWPLLRGAVEVARFVLVEPVVHLEVAANGQPNWQFKPAGGAGEAAPTTETPSPPRGGGSPTLPITAVRLGDIRIENGTLTYTDAASGTSERVEAIDLRLDLPDLQSALQAKGSLDYKGETIALDLVLDSPMAVIEGGSSPLRLAVDSDPAEVGFEGEVSNGAEPGASGGIDLDVRSIRALAAWLGEPIAFQGEGLEKLTIEGRLEGSAKRVAFSDAQIGLDAITGQGELVADLSGEVPQLSGRLDLGAVDLDPYLPPATETSEAGQPGATGQGQAAGGAGAGSTPKPSGEQPVVAAANGWSDEPIALPPLGGVGIDFELTLEALQVQALEIGRTVLGLTLKGNTLEATLREFALYDGQGKGTLRIALEDGAPAISGRFQLEGLQALPFLTAAAGFERLEGTASAELDLTSRGRSERQLVQNLDGSGKVTFRDGAIVGINIAAMVRNAADAFLNPQAGETRKTDFAELGGSFTITDGVLRNDDMRLQAPALRVDGSGRVNLPKRTLNYRLEPKAAATLKGQGGEREVAGLLVPVIIKGPWDDLTYAPDLSAVAKRALENPEAIEEQIKQLGDQGEALKDALKGLDKKQGREAAIESLTKALGAEQKPAEDNAGAKEGTAKEPAKPEEQVQKLLKGLLGN